MSKRKSNLLLLMTTSFCLSCCIVGPDFSVFRVVEQEQGVVYLSFKNDGLHHSCESY